MVPSGEYLAMTGFNTLHEFLKCCKFRAIYCMLQAHTRGASPHPEDATYLFFNTSKVNTPIPKIVGVVRVWPIFLRLIYNQTVKLGKNTCTIKLIGIFYHPLTIRLSNRTILEYAYRRSICVQDG